jgi:carbonic anhydrase
LSRVLDEVLAANQQYVHNFNGKERLTAAPSRKFAILTCMDARINPFKIMGLNDGDAHIIRNAGGRASDDALRSLIISYKLLGTQEWFVIHHTNCGMQSFNNEVIRNLLASSLKPAFFDETGWHDSGKGEGSTEGDFIDWLTFANLPESVVNDVKRIRQHPLVPKEIPIYGFIYDVKTGKLIEVPEATEIGKQVIGDR